MLQNRIKGNVEVETTTSYQEAVGLAVTNQVDICITDLDMPKRNGIDLLRSLKVNDPLTLVIVLTAVDSEGALRTCLSYGADDYLFKPVQWEAIIESVQFQISRLQRYRSELEYIRQKSSSVA